MIEVAHLSKSFEGLKVLDDISFEIKDEEILVILGESGSGKSVLLRHLIGLLKPDRGTIKINGVDITELSEKELLKLRKGIGYLFQEGALYDFMSVYENIAFPLHEHTSLGWEQMDEKVKNVLQLVDLEDAGDKYPSELSGGMKKRAGLARAMILGSKILFCDEPTSGLDPIRSRDISNLIQKISRQLKCTTVMTSHDIYNSLRIADRIVLIHQAKIIAQGSVQELKKSDDSFVQEFMTSSLKV